MARPEARWVPPLRDGVSASRVAVQAGPWATVLDYLLARLPLVADWPARLQQGEVLDATGQAVGMHSPASPGALLWYWRKPPPEARLPFEVDVLHQDEHLVIADKPHFMAVTPGGQHLHETVLVRLKQRLSISTLVPMHRLDRETAGVMAFIVRPQDRNAYQGLLRQQQVHKVYEAVAPWRADVDLPQVYSSRLMSQDGENFMQMLTLPGAPNAHTRIECLQRWAAPADGEAGATRTLALYRLTPLTGSKHQLRVHLNALGLPIVGDRIYPRLWPHTLPGEPQDFAQPLQLLARELAFTDPISGQMRHYLSRRRLQCVPDRPGLTG